MDANLQRCPKCNHTVSSAAGTCAYCGATMSAGEPPGPAVEKIASEPTGSAPSAPPLQSEAASPVAEIYAESVDTAEPVETPAEPDLSEQPPQAEASEPELKAEAEAPEAAAQTVESPEAPTETAPLADVSPEKAEEEINLELNMNETAAEAGSQISQQKADIPDEAEIVLTESLGQTPDPLLVSKPAEAYPPDAEAPADAAAPAVENTPQTETVLEQVQEAPAARELRASAEPEVIELTGDEPVEWETLGTDIIEMVELEASRQEPQKPAVLDALSPPQNDGGESGDDRKDDLELAEVEEIAAETESALMPESLGDTILLEEPAEEVRPAAADGSGTLEAPGNSEIKTPAGAPRARPDPSAIKANVPVGAVAVKKRVEAGVTADVLKIEKAAQDMVAAIQQQKGSPANSDKAEKPKAAEARDQALMMQKAAQAKARAQKKQNLIMAQAAALKRKKAAEAKVQALKKQKQAQAGLEAANPAEAIAAPVKSPGGRSAAAGGGTAQSRMKNLLQKYQGQAIGINYDNSMEVKEAKLVEANSEFFSVFVRDQKLHYSYPLKNIFTVIEGRDGVEAGTSGQQGKFNAVIKVYPLVPF